MTYTEVAAILANTRGPQALQRKDLLGRLLSLHEVYGALLKARREHLRECLRDLPEQHRELVRGYYYDDETIESLARRQGRGSEAVYKALQRIRQTLHHCMQRKQQATS